MTSRVKILLAFAALSLTAGVGYVGTARDRLNDDIDQASAEAEEFLGDWRENAEIAENAYEEPTGATTTVAPNETADDRLPFVPGDLVIVNHVPGADYGKLAVWRDGERVVFEQACDRAHASTDRLVCLRPGSTGPYAATEFYTVAESGFERQEWADSGLASRARVSPGGRTAAGTVFVSGHSYLDVGEFATATNIFEDVEGNIAARALERDFTVASDERRFDAPDGNWWGVTFGPGGDEFFVTYSTDESVELLRGTVRYKILRPYLEGLSCPSLSPDGSHLVAKRTTADGSVEMVLVDTETKAMTVLPEDRMVEDQVEWLDDDTILYALPHPGTEDGPQPAMDIWALDIATGAEPELFLPYAASPAAVRNG